MRLKKIAALAMAAALTLSMFTGCNWNPEDEEDASSSSSSSSSSTSTNSGTSGDSSGGGAMGGGPSVDEDKETADEDPSDDAVTTESADAVALREVIKSVTGKISSALQEMMNNVDKEEYWTELEEQLVSAQMGEAAVQQAIAFIRANISYLDKSITVSTGLNRAAELAAQQLEDNNINITIEGDIEKANGIATEVVNNWASANNFNYYNGAYAAAVSKTEFNTDKEQFETVLTINILMWEIEEARAAAAGVSVEYAYELGLASFTDVNGIECYVVSYGVIESKT